MSQTPRIKAVKVVGPLKLVVAFTDGSEKEYDCTPLLARPQFRLLKDSGFFRSAEVAAGGYGISWNDDVDLSEHELWTNGTTVRDDSSQQTVSRPAGFIIG